MAKTLYSAGMHYRTPSGRRRYFCGTIAANTLAECEEELERRLMNEVKFGRRLVASIEHDLTATIIGEQIATK